VDDAARIGFLAEASALKWHNGRRDNWSGYGLDCLRAECVAFAAEAAALRAGVVDAALRRLADRIATATLEAARERRVEGQLEFHDLLVLARDLLRSSVHGAAVRTSLQRRYRRLLLDEFQDTDPIQVELAVRIAAGAAGGAGAWEDVPVPEGSLFLVGDPKQSIYRFRRADIATYLEAQQRIGDQLVLQANFRTTKPVLAWINHVFGQLIAAEPKSQPPYHPLQAVRAGVPDGPAVTLLGACPHADRPSADDLRAREAADVAAVVRTALAQRWQVAAEPHSPDGDGWRDVRLGDIAVLLPARTSLPHLEDALDAAGIPYRAEASSLVYRSREVRDLLTAARAADDPSDPLALVAALRSPLFGCGDDDLWTWQQAGGRWNIFAPLPDTVPAGHPVRDAVTYLRRLHDDRTWLAPSEVLGRLATDRRMLEVAVGRPRARDVWRRLRFVIDQARAWSEAEHGGLRAYLTWAGRQGQETTRVAEAVLPETDTDALRILTVHAAKGLEFPVVILSGMSSRPGGLRGGVDVIWTLAGGCEFKLRKDIQTGDLDTAKPIDEQMDSLERVRLLYVACTRARDHLIVPLHVGTVIGERVLEGFIDLIYRDDGLVIVDYKTDTVPAIALEQRVAFYRPQMAAYATALHAATQEPITRCILVFLSPGGAVERTVEGIEEATASYGTR
jgi:ATP-dependent exoDNAse (exonuclease V) beta subunit